jgi:hypothetical protein
MTFSKRSVIGVLILIALCALVAKCALDSKESRRQDEAIATAKGFAKVIQETLTEKTSLVVQEANGTLQVTAVNHGTVFDTWQKSTVPYTVQYSVDLSKVSNSTSRYDDESKTLFVQIPAITVSPPNVDETRKVITGRGGIWTSREAAENLAARSSKLAVGAATASAFKPEKIKTAQEKARVKVDHLLETALGAIGKKGVDVVVRFPSDGASDGDRWDVSPSIQQVLARDLDKN